MGIACSSEAGIECLFLRCMFLMGSHSVHSLYLHLLARYPTVIRISCGALRTPPARCALLKHDM